MSTQCLEVCNGELLSSGVMMCIELINQCNDTEECYIVFLRLGLHDRFCIFYLGWCSGFNKNRPVTGGARKRNFWTSCTNPGKSWIYITLTSKAFDWYMYGSDPRKRGVGGPSFLGGSKTSLAPFTEFQLHHLNSKLKPSRLAPFLSKLS